MSVLDGDLGAKAIGLVAVVAGRALLGRVRRLGRWAMLSLGPTADRVAVAPQDIRTGDPTFADEIYAGRFAFAGRVVETHGASPFEMEPPSQEWARALQGFGWLRHLRVADTAIARSNARALVDDWMKTSGRRSAHAWEPDVAARRILAFLAQSPMLLDGCDGRFYRRFLRTVTRHFRKIFIRVETAPNGLVRLKVLIALVALAVSVDSFKRYQKHLLDRLDAELARQIFPDGGHIGRDPSAIVEILVDLLPVRQAQAARGIPVSRGVMNAVDRMMHLLRFFRHADGMLALFNGASAVPLDQIATVLAHDDAHGKPPGNAPHSGYQRLEGGRTVVIMDCGAPPPPRYAHDAHAGTLSFEFSSGATRFVVNCGAAARSREAWRRIARATAAHSTLMVGRLSSARFANGLLERIVGPTIVAGPRKVTVDRQEHGGSVAVIGAHDGYIADVGLRHERTIRMSASGDRIDGRDRLVRQPGRTAPGIGGFAVRFHLHPLIKISLLPTGAAILLAPDGEGWEFHADGAPLTVADSVFLADPHGPKPAQQLVLSGEGAGEVRWTFLRAADPIDLRRRT